LPYHHRHRRIITEPEWRPQNHYTSTGLPPECRAWLLDDGSLTGRLIDLGQGALRVERLYQGWQVPLASERRLLALAPRHVALVREVALRIGGDAVIFARSVFPIVSLTGSLAHLRRLRNRSLGAILFQHRGMQRSPFELALIAGDSDYLPETLQQEEAAWGRRSRFEIAGKALLVSEVFLQAFTPWPAVLPVHRTQRGKVNAAILRSTQ